MNRVPQQVTILSGAGLSAASGVPTFRDADGLWEGHNVQDVATPEAWLRDAELVRTFYDERRIACEAVVPNPGHTALATLQRAWGADRVVLITQNIDGLLQSAGCGNVIEMHGSLFRLRCEHDESHPHVAVAGAQSRTARCRECGGRLRPAVVWFGEIPNHMDRIQEATWAADTFISVGTSGLVYPAASLSQIAKAGGATTIEVNPDPVGGDFDYVLNQRSETALPALVGRWLEASA